jgi:FkbM family methyltransferase
MNSIFKKIAARLPLHWQQSLKRIYYRQKILRQELKIEKIEYELIDSLISSEDWVIDIGANIGDYTMIFSNLVGPKGRVIALEPVPKTFELLAANAQLFPFQNVTLINMAASDISSIVCISIPFFQSGLQNYYQASISENSADLSVMSIPIDSLSIPHSIKLVKIDVEGHELQVLHGMINLINRDYPTLIVETNSKHVEEYLGNIGYTKEIINGLDNIIFKKE